MPIPMITTSGYSAMRAHQHNTHGGKAMTSLKNRLPTTDESAMNHAAYGNRSFRLEERFSISIQFTRFASSSRLTVSKSP